MASDEEEAASIYELHLLTMKPMLYIANVDEDAVDAELPEIDGCVPVPISAKVEADIAELSELDPEEAAEYMEALGLTQSLVLAAPIHEAYALLGLQSYFTSGETETRAWTIPVGAKAPQAAGVIHTDLTAPGFHQGRDRQLRGLRGARRREGLPRRRGAGQEGKDYVVQDGDVMHFKLRIRVFRILLSGAPPAGELFRRLAPLPAAFDGYMHAPAEKSMHITKRA